MTAGDRLEDALARAAQVEQTFGDPWDTDNPVGHASVLAADQAGEMLSAGIRRWQRLSLSAELVPAEYGGRLTGLDLLGVVMRPLFRRDPALAFGYGFTPFMGAMMVLQNGTDSQRRQVAAVLDRGGTIGVACQRFQHESEFHAQEYTVSRDGAGFRLHGSKNAINNAHTAELIIGFVASGGAGEYSLLMFDPAAAPPQAVRSRPRHRTTGARGLQVAGLEFVDCPLPADALVGAWGSGVELGMRAFPAIHASFSSMVIGLADTALRCGVTARKGAHARAVIAGAFADLLLADALSVVATRAVHLIPAQCDVLTAVGKYLVPKLIGDSMYELACVLGDDFHADGGPHAVSSKHLRDLGTVAFGHVSSTVCQSIIVPYLPLLAADQGEPGDAPDELFQIRVPVPPLDPARLGGFGGRDGLAARLSVAPAQLADGPLRELTEMFAADLSQIRAGAASLRAGGGDLASDARIFPLADRYALVLAAASALGVWLAPPAAPFQADPSWVLLALHRLARRLGRRPAPLPPAVAQQVYREALDRVQRNRSLDLLETELR